MNFLFTHCYTQLGHFFSPRGHKDKQVLGSEPESPKSHRDRQTHKPRIEIWVRKDCGDMCIDFHEKSERRIVLYDLRKNSRWVLLKMDLKRRNRYSEKRVGGPYEQEEQHFQKHRSIWTYPRAISVRGDRNSKVRVRLRANRHLCFPMGICVFSYNHKSSFTFLLSSFPTVV